ncbi:MAG: hypothetical protein IT294_07545 [Deltaproteobacteria bacterium]|nr:hypothetical protein [Deltaproteobacteria bacterium]
MPRKSSQVPPATPQSGSLVHSPLVSPTQRRLRSSFAPTFASGPASAHVPQE